MDKLKRYKNGILLLALLISLQLSACTERRDDIPILQSLDSNTSQPIENANVPVINPTTEKEKPTNPPSPIPTVDYGKDYQAIQLTWFYKPPASGDLNSISKNYSRFILTRMDERERDVLRGLGVKTPILQYLLFSEIQDPGSCTQQPMHDQVAEQVNDFCTLTNQHPDWFLYDSNGNVISHPDGYKMMDPGNQNWREFWLERARLSQEKLGWQGVFLDNVEASLGKRVQSNGLPNKYPDDASYTSVIEDNLRYLYVNYFKPQNRPVLANIISINDPSVWFRYLAYLDGAFLENFAVGWEDDYLSESEWEMQLDIVEKTQAFGKDIILVSQGNEMDGNRQLYSLASYLLVNNGRAYFRYTNDKTYDQNWLYDNYKINLGRPLGQRYKVGDTWLRNFTNGTVSVTPASNTAKIIPPG